MKHRIVLSALAYLLLTVSANAAPVTISPNPTADGYADFLSGATLVADNDALLVQRTAVVDFRSALEFDISAIPAGMVIISADLNLYIAPPTPVPPPPRIAVQGYTGNGTIETNDFFVNNEIAQFDPVTGLNTIDVTTFVQGEYGAGNSMVGFQLRELGTESNSFVSSNSTSGDPVPSLVVTYQAPALPEPASLALVVLGVAGLRLSRRLSK